jgi:SseB protein N-terminal domain
MDGEFSSQWRPEPEPQNALERLMAKAVRDPAVHGKMMRMLWSEEITTLAPYHPEMLGEHALQAGQSLQFIIVKDQRGGFIPAFTSQASADAFVEKNAPPGRIGMLTLPGEAFFQFVNGMKHRVVFNPGMPHGLELQPEAIASLVSGDLRHNKPPEGSGESTQLFPVDEATIPEALKDGVRRFCDRNRSAIAIYAFLVGNPATGQADPKTLRLVMRLRRADDDFYNDFYLMTNQLLPPGLNLALGVITPEDEAALEFLSRCKPLWPVMPEV